MAAYTKKRMNDTHDINHDDEAAAAKLWAVYVSEADKYDRGLVEGWKSDMEGLLIFAALFSAILTAFIIESYKSLNPDSGDQTVHLLAQISQQLAAASNGGTYPITPSQSFTPTISSLICNGLWFISLGFSLACALIATFVQQWARDFLHKADIHSAPVIRARIFSYLYYGLRRFRMHTVVEIIPLLLHGSLLLFFSGLVAFLNPVNIAMMVIAGILLIIIVVVYSIFTLFPLFFLDCPYQTPLSGTFWRILQAVQSFWHHLHPRPTNDVVESDLSDQSDKVVFKPQSLHDGTLVEAMSHTAMETSKQRSDRDHKALVWTMKSLADNTELEPFVEAIPDILWGPTGRRHTYEDHIQGLIRNPDVHLLNRIATLLQSCSAGVLSVDASQRRYITCYKALWAVASLSKPHQASDLWNDLDFSHIFSPLPCKGAQSPYSVSAKAVIPWSIFCTIKDQLTKLREYLTEVDKRNSKVYSPNSVHVSNSLLGIHKKFYALQIFTIPKPQNFPSLHSVIDTYLSDIPYHIFLKFLSSSAYLEAPPYQWEQTCTILRVSRSAPVSPNLKKIVEQTIHEVISSQIHRLNAATDDMKTEWINNCICELVSLWQPNDDDRIHWAIVLFLNNCKSYKAVWELCHSDDIESRLWKCFRRTLLDNLIDSVEVCEEFTAMWRLASICIGIHPVPNAESRWTSRESALKALSTDESPLLPITYSITLFLKLQLLRDHDFPWQDTTVGDILSWFNHYLLPTETATRLPDELCSMQGEDPLPSSQWPTMQILRQQRVSEACLNAVAEYLEHCFSATLPYNSVETLKMINNTLDIIPHAPIDPTHQMRLANAIHSIFTTVQPSMELMEAIVSCLCWSLYAEGSKTEVEVKDYHTQWVKNYLNRWRKGRYWPWLNDPVAQQKIKDAFMVYEGLLKLASHSSRGILLHLQRILRGLDSWHNGPDIMPCPGCSVGDMAIE
ncbi:hypothetical protein B0H13DRAFT_2202781 [Mycena leptocephala]|nr:hypothetical protein B0H13DRAFT_2202781 [Mycena leptocephala]